MYISIEKEHGNDLKQQRIEVKGSKFNCSYRGTRGCGQPSKTFVQNNWRTQCFPDKHASHNTEHISKIKARNLIELLYCPEEVKESG